MLQKNSEEMSINAKFKYTNLKGYMKKALHLMIAYKNWVAETILTKYFIEKYDTK